ncbi:response regulator [Bacillus andreraoultii]|uniref:response regulator n=1 Tax=Bacillus andreraoultii TaxID=1499685 RepID=UPI000B16B702|nr:response regulator [Bacillus andreraoultii]
MLKSIIVGSSKQEVNLLEEIFESTNKIKIVGKFLCEHQNFEELECLSPEVVFILIECLGVKGIQFAENVIENVPNAKIVFISKSKDYAVQAFELGAVDYILKPFDKLRLHKTIKRIKNKKQLASSKEKYSVCCFKDLHFKCNGVEMKQVKWRTAKAKELFAFLIHSRSETVIRKDIIIDTLWPDEDMDKAYEKLYVTICHIRRTLRKIGVKIDIVSKENGYELIFNDVICENDKWEKEVQEFTTITCDTLNKGIDLIKQYKGDYLVEESYIWAENEQERLRVLYQALSNHVLKLLFNNKRYTEVSLLALKNQRLYPYLQDSYLMLMLVYDKLGDIHHVEKQYEKLTQMMKEEFNTLPNEEIREWYRNWVKKHSIDSI